MPSPRNLYDLESKDLGCKLGYGEGLEIELIAAKYWNVLKCSISTLTGNWGNVASSACQVIPIEIQG